MVSVTTPLARWRIMKRLPLRSHSQGRSPLPTLPTCRLVNISSAFDQNRRVDGSLIFASLMSDAICFCCLPSCPRTSLVFFKSSFQSPNSEENVESTSPLSVAGNNSAHLSASRRYAIPDLSTKYSPSHHHSSVTTSSPSFIRCLKVTLLPVR